MLLPQTGPLSDIPISVFSLKLQIKKPGVGLGFTWKLALFLSLLFVRLFSGWGAAVVIAAGSEIGLLLSFASGLWFLAPPQIPEGSHAILDTPCKELQGSERE